MESINGKKNMENNDEKKTISTPRNLSNKTWVKKDVFG